MASLGAVLQLRTAVPTVFLLLVLSGCSIAETESFRGGNELDPSPTGSKGTAEAPLHRLCEERFERGGLKLIRAERATADGVVADGPFLTFYESGHPCTVGSYRLGSEEGLWLYFWSNGNIRGMGCYADGIRISVWREWDDKGNLYSTINHHGDGWSEESIFYSNGKLRQYGYLYHKEPRRIWIGWHGNGNIKFVDAYSESGELTFHASWNEQGAVDSRE